MNGWGLVNEMKARHRRVNHEQLAEYRRWGLIGEPDAHGEYPADTLARLVEIHGRPGHLLARRVIALRANRSLFPVPPRRVRDAMTRVLPGIKASYRKMLRIDRAVHWWVALQERRPPPGRSWGRKVPRRERWAAILHGVDDDVFEERLSAMYHLDAVLCTDTVGAPYELGAIPVEERIILLLIRDLDRLHNRPAVAG
jgi:hypothetical protein